MTAGGEAAAGGVVVVYFSATGTTAALAAAAVAGAESVLATHVHRIVDADLDAGRFRNEAVLARIDEADAIIFGSPTYMGGPAAQFKAFADATSERYSARAWVDKVAAGFTTGACPNGDQGHTLTYFTVLAAQHGMIWCNLDLAWTDHHGHNRLGVDVGVTAQPIDGVLPATDLDTARHHGARVARLAAQLRAR